MCSQGLLPVALHAAQAAPLRLRRRRHFDQQEQGTRSLYVKLAANRSKQKQTFGVAAKCLKGDGGRRSRRELRYAIPLAFGRNDDRRYGGSVYLPVHWLLGLREFRDATVCLCQQSALFTCISKFLLGPLQLHSCERLDHKH